MALPQRTPEQQRLARDRATEVRRVRAELKQMLKGGEVGLPELIDRADGNDIVARMKVAEVLESLPAHGKVKAARIMDELRIAPSRRLRGLGPRQREALVARFGPRR